MKNFLLLPVALLFAAVAINAAAESENNLRRLGGLNEPFCQRSVDDCCGEKSTVDENLPYPNCRCPKRKKGYLEEPFLFFGSYGGDDGICAKCETFLAENR